MTRRQLLIGAAQFGASALATDLMSASAPSYDPPDDELIRVSADKFGFETARTRRRFIPFGANLVLTNQADLNMFGPRYSRERYDRILAACESLRINLLKVFLPVGSVMPDPQQPGAARIAVGYIDHLENFLSLCQKHHIRAVVTLAEWGGAGCKWWQEGGQYFGRRPWKTDTGVNSLDILCRFWTSLASRLRGNPTVFSYSPCVEWSMPNGNLTPPWAPSERETGIVPGEIALWYWRTWLLAKYGTLDRLNRAWGARYGSPNDIPVVDYSYDTREHRSLEPERKVLDYQNFREWATLRYFRPQIAAIRAADPTHLVTISNHMRSWNLWEGAARHFLGYTPAEEAPLIDYVTHHANYDENDLTNGRTLGNIVREVEVMLRFAHAGRPMPVMLEEFTFASADGRRTAESVAAIVRGTFGHASGWTTWYLQYPKEAGAADTAHRMAWLDDDLVPTPWGEIAKMLFEEMSRTDLRRKPARRVLKLERVAELVPKRTGALISTYTEYDRFDQPTDYRLAHEPDLDIRLESDASPLHVESRRSQTTRK
jgi:Beta-galactosidase